MNVLDKVMAEINKKYKSNIIQLGTERAYVEKIPFSSPRANYMTYGGIPKGKSTEFFGPEGGGKTTAALDVTGQAQKAAKKVWLEELDNVSKELEILLEKNNKSDKDKIKKLTERKLQLETDGPRKAVYFDTENTLDEDWAQKNGVDTDALYLVRPDDQTAEQVLQMVLDIVDTGQVEILVIDSIPMLVSQQIFDQTLEKKSYGGIAGALTEFSRRISSKISRHHTALLSINQSRDDLNNEYNLYNTPGGRAWKHLHALRIYCRKGMFLDEKNQEIPQSKAATPYGNKGDLKIIKTKVCKPDRLTGFHTINYGRGIDVLNDTIEMAIQYGFITQSGAWFYIMDPETGEVMTLGDGESLRFQGRPKLLGYLEEDTDLFDELYEAVNQKIMGMDTQEYEDYDSEPDAVEEDSQWKTT
jgi:recombination protein RecA